MSFHHSEETKQKISEKRKEWLKNNPDKHVWKKHTKFISVPCENFKNFLRLHNIDFIEEYSPLKDYNFAIDIAWPDIKVGVEINGNQHYNLDGSLTEYYQNRHNILENYGWKIFEIHYTKCYNIKLTNFTDILNLDIYDKQYVKSQFDRVTKYQQRQLDKEKILEKRLNRDKQRRDIIYNLINNSGIDFSKSTWSSLAVQYLNNRGELWNKVIFRCIRKYAPEFLLQDNVWKRKGSKLPE